MQNKWTTKDKIAAYDMNIQGIHVRQIAASLGRSYGSVDAFLRRDSINAARRRRTKNEGNKQRGWFDPVKKIFVPPQLWDDREKRANEPRTLSQEMFGDPPFSQSALARGPTRTSAGLVQSRESLRD